MSRNAYGQRFVHPAMTAFEALTVEGATFGYDEVVDYQVSSVVERDWDGQLLCSAIYGFASALFLLGILIGSLDLKFLIAVVFLASICLMSINDAFGTKPVTLHILEMTLDDGRQVRFVDGDWNVVGTLVARIDHARGY